MDNFQNDWMEAVRVLEEAFLNCLNSRCSFGHLLYDPRNPQHCNNCPLGEYLRCGEMRVVLPNINQVEPFYPTRKIYQ